MLSTAEQPDFVSVEDYLAREELSQERHEYIDGWTRGMSGANVRHNQVSGQLFGILFLQLQQRKCRPYHLDMKVRVRNEGTTWFYYPDVCVVCESNDPTDAYQDRPVLIAEVLSRSTRSIDFDEKMTAYLLIPSLHYYLRVEQDKVLVTLMRRTPQGFLRETFEGLHSVIDLPVLECRPQLSDLYRGIEVSKTAVREDEPAYDGN